MTAPCPKCGGNICPGLALCHGCREDFFRHTFRRKSAKELIADFNAARVEYCDDMRARLKAAGSTRSVSDAYWNRNPNGVKW